MLLMGALVPILIAALAASLGRKAWLPAVVILGTAVGCLAGLALVLGNFAAFAWHVGGRDLTEFRGDMTWQAQLAWGSIVGAAGGSVVGLVCGAAAWALLTVLGHEPEDRDRYRGEASP
jgi:hypothetical protein